jgi:hypothetical protein
VLWDCAAVADGWHVLLGAKRVDVVCALRLVVAVLHHLLAIIGCECEVCVGHL